jgi:hypothetical protein
MGKQYSKGNQTNQLINNMAERLTTEKFIIKAREVHGDRYDYSNSSYEDSKTKVSIYCFIHGNFHQNPQSHLQGLGCRKCGTISRLIGITKELSQVFEDKARKIHGDKYSYEDCKYINQRTKVTITCRLHGKFDQTPKLHLQGKGCIPCGHITMRNKKKQSTQEFIQKALLVHNNLYDYSKVDYINPETKVKVICKVHGEFLQFPYNHLQGHICNLCVSDKKKVNPKGWTKTNWANSAKTSKTFDSFKVYILKLSREDETFYKIGRTYRKASVRASSFHQYACEVIHCISNSDPSFIFDLENSLKKEYRTYKYLPKIRFDGMHECFNMDLPIEQLIAKHPQ